MGNGNLDNYFRVLGDSTFASGLVNSLLLGLSAAAIAMPICTLMAYAVHRGIEGRAKKMFEFVGTAPIGFPGMILSLGLLWLYFGTFLYNSWWGLLLAYLIFYIPYGLRTTSAAIIRIHKELEEAASVHGSPFFHTFTRIICPLLRTAIGAGFFYIFISIQRNLGEVVLLAGPGVQVGPTIIFDYFNIGQWGICAAAIMIYSSLLFCYVVVAKFVLKINFRL